MWGPGWGERLEVKVRLTDKQSTQGAGGQSRGLHGEKRGGVDRSPS